MIKTLASCVKQYKRDSLLTPLYVVLEVVMEVLIPLMMANLIDYGIEAGNMSYIRQMGLKLIVAALLSLTFGTLAGSYAAKASAGYARNLRHEMYYKVQDFSFGNIDKFSHGQHRDPADHGRNQCAERFSDDHPHRRARPGHDDLFPGDGFYDQSPAFVDLSRCHSVPRRRLIFDHQTCPSLI